MRSKVPVGLPICVLNSPNAFDVTVFVSVKIGTVELELSISNFIPMAVLAITDAELGVLAIP
jgi:hypothetical protein